MCKENSVYDHKIMNMDKGKRDKLLNAAMVEFSKGYKQASTDAIVKNAGISKGLLYHYFGTKKDLYLYLWEYALQVVNDEFFSLLNLEETDIFERIIQIVLLKMDLMQIHPALFEFLLIAYNKDQKEEYFNDEKKAAYTQVTKEVYQKLFTDYDTSKFKEGVDPQRVVQIFFWTLQGYSESIIKTPKSIPEHSELFPVYIENIKQYAQILINAFYK